MNLTEVNKQFNTYRKCLDYMEKLRWGKVVTCTKCNSNNVVAIGMHTGRFHCNACKTTFSVLSDTIFEDSKLILPKWFMLINLMLNAKMGISSKELERNVGLTYKTAWFCSHRVRCAMIDHCKTELESIIEMDETYIGGKPRLKYTKDDSNPNMSQITNKRGRGTKKTPIVGIVERKGEIVLKVIEKLTSRNLLAMLKENVKLDESIVVTDEFKSYKSFDEVVQHYTIQHSKKEYVRGAMHLNTVEGFWAIVKNSIKGSYRAISKRYLPLYLVQSAYNFNFRNYKGNLFEEFMKQALTTDKPMENYTTIKTVKETVYKQSPKC